MIYYMWYIQQFTNTKCSSQSDTYLYLNGESPPKARFKCSLTPVC